MIAKYEEIARFQEFEIKKFQILFIKQLFLSKNSPFLDFAFSDLLNIIFFKQIINVFFCDLKFRLIHPQYSLFNFKIQLYS
jgi:hypothetical protein